MKKFCRCSLLLTSIILFQSQLSTYKVFATEAKINVEKKADAKKINAENLYEKGREAYLNFNFNGYKDSITLYNKVINIDKNHAKALAAKAESQALLSRIIYDSTGDIKKSTKLENSAFENAFIALDLNPNLKETNRAMSMVYFIQENYEEGKKLALKALKLEPDDAESNLLLWMNSPDPKIFRGDKTEINYYKSLDLKSDILDKVFELNSNLIMAYFERGKALSYQSEYFKAIKNYKKIIDINPSNEEAYITLGLLYSNSPETNDAIEQFNKAIDIDPDRYDAIYNLGVLHLKQRNVLLAQEFLNKVCDYDYLDSCDLVNGINNGKLRPYVKIPKERRKFNEFFN